MAVHIIENTSIKINNIGKNIANLIFAIILLRNCSL